MGPFRNWGIPLARHIAILQPPFDRMILDGVKQIESRVTVTPRPPFGVIQPGETIHIKRSSGPFVATAVASRVLTAELAGPRQVQALFKQYGKWIGVDGDYWRLKQRARYATLIWLRDVHPSSVTPRYRPVHMRAWYVLEDDAVRQDHDAFEVELTDGGVRLGYVIVRAVLDQLPKRGEVELLPPRGEPIRPRFDRRKRMLRGAALRDWMRSAKLHPGDRVEFAPVGPRRFAIRPLRIS